MAKKRIDDRNQGKKSDRKKKSGRKMVAETILSVGKKIGKKSGAEEGERFEEAVKMINAVENRRKKSEAEGAKG